MGQKYKAVLFTAINEEQQSHVAAILTRYEPLVDTRKNRSAADPFVIALAMAEGCAVVTAEAPTGKVDRPNIPDVCTGFSIRCLGLLEFSVNVAGDSERSRGAGGRHAAGHFALRTTKLKRPLIPLICCALSASACPKTLVVDSIIALEIDARVQAADTGDGIDGVEISFRDISLDESAPGVERRVGTTDPTGSYKGIFDYSWGREVRGNPSPRPLRQHKFELLFRRAGFREEAVSYDLDRLPSTAVNTYEVRSEVRLSRSAQ